MPYLNTAVPSTANHKIKNEFKFIQWVTIPDKVGQ